MREARKDKHLRIQLSRQQQQLLARVLYFLLRALYAVRNIVIFLFLVSAIPLCKIFILAPIALFSHWWELQGWWVLIGSLAK